MKSNVKVRLLETLALVQHEAAYATEYILGDQEADVVLEALEDLKELAADLCNMAADNRKDEK